MTRPEKIRQWVQSRFTVHQVDVVTNDLIDVAAGNRPGNTFENQAIAEIFKEGDTVTRHCVIEEASVGHNPDADGDGAYDLHDVQGTPEEVGAAITESLRTTQMMRGTRTWLPETADLYMKITVKICKTDTPERLG